MKTIDMNEMLKYHRTGLALVAASVADSYYATEILSWVRSHSFSLTPAGALSVLPASPEMLSSGYVYVRYNNDHHAIPANSPQEFLLGIMLLDDEAWMVKKVFTAPEDAEVIIRLLADENNILKWR